MVSTTAINELLAALSAQAKEFRRTYNALRFLGVEEKKMVTITQQATYEVDASAPVTLPPERPKSRKVIRRGPTAAESPRTGVDLDIEMMLRRHQYRYADIAKQCKTTIEHVQEIAGEIWHKGKKPRRKRAVKPANGRRHTSHRIHAAPKGRMRKLIIDCFKRHNNGPIGVNVVLEHVLANKPTSLKHEPKTRMRARVQTHLWSLTQEGVLKGNGRLPGTNCKTWTLPAKG